MGEIRGFRIWRAVRLGLSDGSVVALALCLAIVCICVPSVTFAGSCSHDGSHWYAQNWSGAGVMGTRVDASLPYQWSVTGSGSTTDEAAWLINTNNASNSLEGGWFSGNWPYGSGGWFSGLRAYYTKSNGLTGSRGSVNLPASQPVTMDVVSGGRVVIDVYNGPYTSWGLTYSVANGWNWAQGEVTANNATTMGNGPDGLGSTGYYTADGTHWYGWGAQSSCNNSPYWDIQEGVRDWINGGPGS